MDTTDDMTTLRTVAQVAELTGVTVRTLHHYDRIGILPASARSDADYRLYSPADVTRLREILVWRRLGVPLVEVARLLDDPATDRLAVLRTQRDLVAARRDELAQLEQALDRAIADETGGTLGTDRDIIEALDGFDPADYEEAARERWGDTDAWRESTRRTKQYGPEQWRTIKGEANRIAERLAELYRDGAAPGSDAAMEAAEQHRAHVTRWFYDASPELHRGLGAMYVSDLRFTHHWDEREPGLATWVRDAFAANADRQARSR